ncbi:MAG: MerR family transcriptional regulator [Candidatus Nanopelagicales bacterium]
MGPQISAAGESASRARAGSSNEHAAEAHAEFGISEVATLAGTTSRTLRHYDDIGLLPPTRTGANGYRYYDCVALARLQRILLLRQLGLGIAAIEEVLTAVDQTTALRAHLGWLQAESKRLDRQIASVERTIDSIERGVAIMAEDMFDGFDHTQYKQEVQERWGAKAYADSDRWWRGLGPQRRGAFQAESAEIIEAWRALRTRGIAVDAPEAMALARRHHAWIAAGWGGAGMGDVPAEALTGLGDMYVADERFAAHYGGVQGASYVRDVLSHYAITELV